jgi:hypothetical protein
MCKIQENGEMGMKNLKSWLEPIINKNVATLVTKNVATLVKIKRVHLDP